MTRELKKDRLRSLQDQMEYLIHELDHGALKNFVKNTETLEELKFLVKKEYGINTLIDGKRVVFF